MKRCSQKPINISNAGGSDPLSSKGFETVDASFVRLDFLLAPQPDSSKMTTHASTTHRPFSPSTIRRAGKPERKEERKKEKNTKTHPRVLSSYPKQAKSLAQSDSERSMNKNDPNTPRVSRLLGDPNAVVLLFPVNVKHHGGTRSLQQNGC